MTSSSSFNYQVGGSLPADAPSYVERQCDRDYYELLKERKYCYVFNCRQMGKSSLRVRVTHKLQAEGVVCATIDPQKIGVEVTCEQWYASAIRSLVGDLDLKSKFDLRSWIRERELLSPVQRFAEFIETVVLQEIDAPIVIFVEEIDRLLSLKFGMDDFFGLVRSFFEDRPTKPDYNRLTFSFLGVATPTDLIQSHNASAFNIGYAVEMAGFTMSEALPLMQALANKVTNPQDYLKEAVKWTGGQPFLIQRLLGMMEKELDRVTPPEKIVDWVENLVQERIVTNWESQDTPPHLTTIRDRVLSVEEKLRGRMLGCYQQVLANGELEDDRSEERSKLRLTGLVVRRDGRLISYNPIYKLVFSYDWAKKQLADLRPPLYAEAFRAWQESEFNETFLLQGQALQDAKIWSKSKYLSDKDQQFLQESQDRETNLKLEVERQARERAEQAREIEQQKREFSEQERKIEIQKQKAESLLLAQRQRAEVAEQAQEIERQKRAVTEESNQLLKKATKRVKIGSLILAVGLLGAAIALVWSTQKVKESDGDIHVAQVRLKSSEASSNFQIDRKFNSLLQALSAGRRVKAFNLSSIQIKDNTDMYVLSSLSQAIYGINELNQLNHKELVHSVAVSPDGRTIVTGSSDKTAKLWNLEGKLLQTLNGHTDKVWSVAFSPDGKMIATGSRDKTAKLWNLEGKELQTLKGHKNSVWSVAFSPAGETIATGSGDNTAKLWNLEGKLLRTITGHTDNVQSLAFSRDGKIMATGSSDKTVKLWNPKNGNKLQTLQGHTNGVNSVAFSRDGKMIATGSSDKTVKLWDLRGKYLKEFKGHTGVIFGVSFSHDSKMLATASDDRTTKLWNLKDRQEVQTFGNSNIVNSVAFSRDDKKIFTANNNKMVQLWSLEKLERKTFTPQKPLKFLTYSPDGKIIAITGNGNAIKLTSPEGKVLKTLTSDNPKDVIWSVAFSPDGNMIANTSNEWSEIATTSKVGVVILWDREGKKLHTLRGHKDEVYSVAFSHDGKTIATGSKDKTVKLWDLNGKLLNTLTGHEKEVLSVAFSHDNKTLATGSGDYKVKLWNRENGQLLNIFDNKDVVWNLAFSPDDKVIATGGGDNTVKLWKLDNGTTEIFQGHGNVVMGVAFSPNGKTIASGSQDNTVKLWSLDGSEIQTFQGHKDQIYSVSFSPDGKTLASGSKDGTVILWNLDLDDLMAKGCAWLHVYLVNNPNASDEDRQMCGIAPRQK